MAALEKACVAALPAMFGNCAVLHYEGGQLLLAAPNAALASKLRQQLPKLQATLQKYGWEVNAIRIKVQVGKSPDKSITSKQFALSVRALDAFDALDRTLEPSARNAGLKAALQAMLQRHRNTGD